MLSSVKAVADTVEGVLTEKNIQVQKHIMELVNY